VVQDSCYYYGLAFLLLFDLPFQIHTMNSSSSDKPKHLKNNTFLNINKMAGFEAVLVYLSLIFQTDLFSIFKQAVGLGIL